MTDLTLETLKKVDFFANLPEEVLEYFLINMEQRTYKAGEILCREGEVDPWLYLIEEGLCRAEIKTENGATQELRIIRPFEMMGLTSLFKGRARSATLQAYTDLKIWALSHQHFHEILFRKDCSSELLLTLLGDFADRIRRKNKTVADLRGSTNEGDLIKVAFFDSKGYTREFFVGRRPENFGFEFFDTRLSISTAALAAGFPVICPFVNDILDHEVLQILKEGGTQMIAMRCAGFNNLDVERAYELGFSMTRVPAYSPYAVAEHAVALIMALNRKTHHAFNRVRDGNFTLEGLLGFDLHGAQVGVVGTGRIGVCLMNILKGFGCKILAYDKFPDPAVERDLAVEYTDFDSLLRTSDVISLHAPLTEETYHMIDEAAIDIFKTGALLINTSRGALIKTSALIDGLKSGKVGGAGLDVYEEESQYFFEDFSQKVIGDDALARLLTLNNVIVTSHQAFFTRQALENIADSTLGSINEFAQGKRGENLSQHISRPK